MRMGFSLSEEVVNDEVRFQALQLLMYAQSNLLVSYNGFNLVACSTLRLQKLYVTMPMVCFHVLCLYIRLLGLC